MPWFGPLITPTDVVPSPQLMVAVQLLADVAPPAPVSATTVLLVRCVTAPPFTTPPSATVYSSAMKAVRVTVNGATPGQKMVTVTGNASTRSASTSPSSP